MIATKKLFRLERDSGNGMWYNTNGEFEGSIREICPDSKNAYLPMEYSELYSADGEVWNSACDNFEALLAWFPGTDIERLVAAGFKLYQYEVTKWVPLEFDEIIFSQSSVISKQLINIENNI